jgi:hypothetical protein
MPDLRQGYDGVGCLMGGGWSMCRILSWSCLTIVVCAVASAPAHAWEKQWNEAPRIEDSCSTYDARYSEAPLFRVAARSKQERAYFFSQKVSCAEGGSRCPSRMKAYLVDGDVVFGGPEDKNFRCIYYGTAKAMIVAGFVSTDNLVPFTEDQELTRDFLLGTWTYDGNPKIVITPVGKDKVRAKGEAGWPGIGRDARHVGEFSAVASWAGKEITFREGDGEYDCRVDLLRRGPYLIAGDNEHCGGLNVRFSSILIKLRGGK